MTSSTPEKFIPVVDVDQAFPAMPSIVTSRSSGTSAGTDTSSAIQAAIRDVLGWRPRVEDPKAFVDALRSSFSLKVVEGHVESRYVPRGYAVQSDLGAVTGGQASFYRRAQVSRTEILRLLDALTPLRTDFDSQDVEAYRGLVRGAVQSLVDELGASGGARLEMVDAYFRGLTGTERPDLLGSADGVAGQLGALRDRLGLIDDNVNTVEEEGVRTAYWTLVDMVTDLQASWLAQRQRFGRVGGFLGTDLIRLSRLMEAAADQVEELEAVLDSVLVPVTERRTIELNSDTGLTLDGLLSWLRSFLTTEGRRLAQDGGRDGIVSGLTPTAIALLKNFKISLADRLGVDTTGAKAVAPDNQAPQVHYLPASCCSCSLPSGMYAARVRIAVASLCRLLTDLARTAQRIGRWSRVVLLNLTFKRVDGREDVAEVEFRGLNLRRNFIPAFIPGGLPVDEGCSISEVDPALLVRAIRGTSTADEESISAMFHVTELGQVLSTTALGLLRDGGVALPAEDVAAAIIDGETGTVVLAPTPRTWPALRAADDPIPASAAKPDDWRFLPDDEDLRFDPELRVDPGFDSTYATVLTASDLAHSEVQAQQELTDLKVRKNKAPKIQAAWAADEARLDAAVKDAEKEKRDVDSDLVTLEKQKEAEPDPTEKQKIQAKINLRLIDQRDAAQAVATARNRRTAAEALKKQADADLTVTGGTTRIDRQITRANKRIEGLRSRIVSRLTAASPNQK